MSASDVAGHADAKVDGELGAASGSLSAFRRWLESDDFEVQARAWFENERLSNSRRPRLGSSRPDSGPYTICCYTIVKSQGKSASVSKTIQN